jgi:Ulp1 family protease
MMDKYEWFGGVYALDEVHKAPFSLDEDMGIIVNLDTSDMTGSHWVALLISNEDKSIEYYDSYGEDPPILLMEQIQNIMLDLAPEMYYQFKVNRVIQQRANSDTCGFFAMRFLIDRLELDKPFKGCTGWSEVMDSERNIKKFKEDFGYV